MQNNTTQTTVKTTEQIKMPEGQKTLVVNPSQRLFSHDERADFYTGHDRTNLQMRNMERVRELQESNDNLQRQIARNQKDLANAHDPLSVLAEIEHCNIMITRNTGEILNIYSQNEMRIKRISELESENLNLQQSMSDIQGNFISCHDMNQRTKIAASFFGAKAQYERNNAEIRDLNHQ